MMRTNVATGRLMSVKVGDYVASDDHEATMTVLKVEADRAFCEWLEDADIEGEHRQGWYAVKDLSVLQSN